MGRRLGFVLPGLPQLFSTKRLQGGVSLFLWVALLFTASMRWNRVSGAISGGAWDLVALVTLVGVLAGVWWWSFRTDRIPGNDAEESAVPSGFAQAWVTFRENRMASLGLVIIIAFYLAMLLAPFLAPTGADFWKPQGGADSIPRLHPPSLGYPLGTDQFYRDLLSSILYGARISLSIGLLAVGISVTLGAFLGAVAGYWGGWVDTVVMRFTDMVMAFPRLVLLIAIVTLFQPSIFSIVAALAFTQWPFTTRLVRGEILALKEREFAEAARALGFSRRRILFRHLLPNALGPIIVVATLGIGNTILLEAGLSFLGRGLPAGTPSWGALVAAGRTYPMEAWWVTTFSGLTIVLAVLAFNLVGDGLRDALDPRQKRGGPR